MSDFYKKLECTLWGVDLVCIFELEELDDFDPSAGHYTKPGKWFLYDVEHKGESIFQLLSEEAIEILEEKQNELD